MIQKLFGGHNCRSQWPTYVATPFVAGSCHGGTAVCVCVCVCVFSGGRHLDERKVRGGEYRQSGRRPAVDQPVQLRAGLRPPTRRLNHSVGFVLIRAADFSVQSAQAPRPYRQALIKIIWRGSGRVATQVCRCASVLRPWTHHVRPAVPAQPDSGCEGVGVADQQPLGHRRQPVLQLALPLQPRWRQ